MYKLIINNPVKFPKNTTIELKKLILGMLEIDINKRYSIDKVRYEINKMK